MRENKQRIFEIDRRMELRLRLAAKRLGDRERFGPVAEYIAGQPEREVVDRLIERVRRL